jgi:hypothetical protein
MAAMPSDSVRLSDIDFDGLARQFLTSDYAGALYVEWPLDRRLEGFLRYCGLTRIADDGDLYRVFLDRVMAYVGAATAISRTQSSG